MRLPNSAHTSRPWRIHELTRDFRLEDVWVHCCIEPKDAGEAQRSGGSPHPKAAKKDSNHSIVAMVCQV
jgi:hypothetical protein